MPDRHVVFMQTRACPRTLKEARALTDAGVRVSLVELRAPNPMADYDLFETHLNLPFAPNVIDHMRHKRAIVRAVVDHVRKTDADLVHTQNGPDCFGAWLPSKSPVPVIHDIHDLQTAEPTYWPETARFHRQKARFFDRMRRHWERRACRRTAAVFTTSPRMADLVRQRHGARQVFAFENKPIRAHFTKKKKLSDTDGGTHVVYAGGISDTPGGQRDLVPVFSSLAAQGLDVHVYHVAHRPEEREAVARRVRDDPRIHLHDLVPQDRFVEEVSQYDHGMIWFTSVNENVLVTTQNKLYEFQVAGVPIITNVQEGFTAEYIRAKGCGITVTDAAEVGDALAAVDRFDLDTRDCFMDGQDILAAYEQVLAAHAPEGTPADDPGADATHQGKPSA